MKTKIFIDEVGNTDLKIALTSDAERFISLTGVVVKERDYYDHFIPVFRDLKKQFFADENIIFHRREMIRAEPPFHRFDDEKIRNEFDLCFLKILEELPFRIVTVAVDKRTLHQDGFNGDPYHLAFFELVEEYLFWLKAHGLVGDVTVEVRGKGQDQSLKRFFKDSFSDSRLAPHLQEFLTSGEIKLGKKSDNCPAMQLADLLAYPSAMSIRSAVEERVRNHRFSAKIVEVLERDKYLTARAKRLISRKKRGPKAPGDRVTVPLHPKNGLRPVCVGDSKSQTKKFSF